jgi:alpha-glucuronidase
MLRRIRTTKVVVSKNRKAFTHQATAAKIKGSLLAVSHTGSAIVQNVALLVGVTAAESQAREDLSQTVALVGSVAGYAASALAGCMLQMRYYQQENHCRGEAQQFSEWTRKLELLELNRLCINSVRVTEMEAMTFLDDIKKRIDGFKKNGIQHVEFPPDLAAPLIGHSSRVRSARTSGGGSNP